MTTPDRARLEALEWVRRIHDRDFDAWDAHVAWLEASDRNAAAFDEALADIDLATDRLAPAAPSPPIAANDDGPSMRRTWWYPLGGGLVAAGVAAILLLRPAPPPDVMRFSTRPGQTGRIPLGSGAVAYVAGGTELSYVRGEPRRVRLERGEATFDVEHDAAMPFVVEVGGATVRDLGTIFDVATSRDRLVVGVRRGTVAVGSGRREVLVAAGRSLSLDGGGVAVVRRTPPDAVGGWRYGRVVFDDATLDQVAADLSSATGLHIVVDPAVAADRFSGVIVLTPDGAALARKLAGVTGRSVVRSADGWRIAARR